jgi:ABC-type sugar transport system, periplasmic component
MMAKRTRITAIIAILFIFLTSACTSRGEPLLAHEPVEVEFWHAMSGDLEKTLQELTDEFNAQSAGVQVKLVNQGDYGSLNEKLTAAVKAKQLPTIAQTYFDWTEKFVQADLVERLNDYMAEPQTGWNADELQDIYPVFLNENNWDGTFYSLPFNKSDQVLFYNKTMLDEAGLDVPATWEEWHSAAVKLTKEKPDGKGRIIGTGFENAVMGEAFNYVLQGGGQFYDPQTGLATFNTPEGAAGIGFVRGMLKDGIARLASEDQFMSTPFGRGDVAMYVGSSAGISFVQSAVGGKFEWGTAALPKGKRSVAFIQGTNITMFNGGTTERKQGAWNYMKFLLSTENNARWAEQTGYLPIRKSVSELDSYKQFVQQHPEMSAGPAQLEAEASLARIEHVDIAGPILIEQMEAMLIGDMPVAEGLAAADEAINAKLATASSSR